MLNGTYKLSPVRNIRRVDTTNGGTIMKLRTTVLERDLVVMTDDGDTRIT